MTTSDMALTCGLSASHVLLLLPTIRACVEMGNVQVIASSGDWLPQVRVPGEIAAQLAGEGGGTRRAGILGKAAALEALQRREQVLDEYASRVYAEERKGGSR